MNGMKILNDELGRKLLWHVLRYCLPMCWKR